MDAKQLHPRAVMQLNKAGILMSLLVGRWFVIRDAHVNNGIALLQPRWTMSLLRGPMTRSELRRALDDHARVIGAVPDLRLAAIQHEPARVNSDLAGSIRRSETNTN